MELQLSYCKYQKNDAVKVLHSMENSAVATGLEKVSFHSSPKEWQCERMFKLLLGCYSHASKVVLKVLQAGLQQFVN